MLKIQELLTNETYFGLKKEPDKAGPSQVIYNSVDFYTEPLRKMRQTVPHNTTQVQGVMVEVKILNF